MSLFLRFGAVSFMIGVFARSFFIIPAIALGLFAVGGVVLSALYAAKILENKKVLFAIALIFGLVFGTVRYEAAIAPGSAALDRQVGQFVVLKGTVIAEPEIKDRYQQVVFGVEREKVLLDAPRYPELKYGDLIEVRGKLSVPENFSDFDWRAYLAKDGVHYEMKNAMVAVTGEGGNGIKRTLFTLARNFKRRIDLLISEPEAAFLNGLLLGDKSGLPANILEDFRLAGVMHLVALSGYNISVVAAGVARVLSFLPIGITVANGVGLIAVLFFVLMTGASTTAIRAGLMAALLVLARSTGRIYEANNALFVAAFFMVLWNPLILKDDISFQLSFLATWGILNVAPYFLRRFNFLPAVFSEALATTLAAQILVTPLLLYAMGYLSLVSIPANLLILPFVPFTMGGGFATYLLSFMPLVAFPAALATDLLLRYEILIAHFFGRMPFAGLTLLGFSRVLVILSYAAIFYWCSRINQEHDAKSHRIVK